MKDFTTLNLIKNLLSAVKKSLNNLRTDLESINSNKAENPNWNENDPHSLSYIKNRFGGYTGTDGNPVKIPAKYMPEEVSQFPNWQENDTTSPAYIYGRSGGYIGTDGQPVRYSHNYLPIDTVIESKQNTTIDTSITYDSSWNSVIFADSKFILTVGDRWAPYSTDGFYWKSAFVGGNSTAYIAYGNEKYVTRLQNPNGIFYKDKTDFEDSSVEWSEATLPEGYILEQIAREIWFVNGKFYARVKKSLTDNNASLISSTDGAIWEVTSAPEAYYYSDIVYGNGKYVLLTYQSENGWSGIKIYCSEDEITWTEVYAQQGDGLNNRLCYANNKFIMVSSRGFGIFYSEDGNTWKASDAPSESYNWGAISYGNGKFVAAGYQDGVIGTSIAYSYDGEKWAKVHILDGYNYANMRKLSFGNDKFLIFRNNNKDYYYSYNGIDWYNSITSYKNAAGENVEFPKEIPTITELEEGKVLSTVDGVLVWVDPPEIEIPNSNIVNGSTEGSTRTINAYPEGTGYTMGNYAFAEGQGTLASGSCAHAEGNGCLASANFSHAEGDGCTASGEAAHAEGEASQATANGAHAEGTSYARGEYSHAEGMWTKANGAKSHSEGQLCEANASCSHAEGSSTKATGFWSHAEGLGTVAAGEAQHAEGKYNIEDSQNQYIHIAGNGTGSSSCSNAYTLDWNGNAVFAGSVTVNGSQVLMPLPAFTAEDNGKILGIENGALAWVEK